MASWKGAGKGALAGGAAGSIIPGFGTGIGALLGALFGAFGSDQEGNFGSWFEGTPNGIQEAENFDPQQLQALQQLLQQGMQQYQNPYQGFEPIRQDIGNYFKSDIMPHIQNQFNSQTGGHFSSGILGSNVARGQMGLADRLASAQAQYGQNQQQNALGAIRTGLSPKTTMYQQQGSPGVQHQLLNLLLRSQGMGG